MNPDLFKRPPPDNRLEAPFFAATSQEVETAANAWMITTLPHNWERDFVHTAHALKRNAPHAKKPAPEVYETRVIITPAPDATPDEIARVRDAIANLPKQRP